MIKPTTSVGFIILVHRTVRGILPFSSSPYRAFFFGSAFFCAELFFLVGLFFLGSAVFFGIDLNLR